MDEDTKGILIIITLLLFLLSLVCSAIGKLNRGIECDNAFGDDFASTGNNWFYNQEINCYNISAGKYHYETNKTTSLKIYHEPYIIKKVK